MKIFDPIILKILLSLIWNNELGDFLSAASNLSLTYVVLWIEVNLA